MGFLKDQVKYEVGTSIFFRLAWVLIYPVAKGFGDTWLSWTLSIAFVGGVWGLIAWRSAARRREVESLSLNLRNPPK